MLLNVNEKVLSAKCTLSMKASERYDNYKISISLLTHSHGNSILMFQLVSATGKSNLLTGKQMNDSPLVKSVFD